MLNDSIERRRVSGERLAGAYSEWQRPRECGAEYRRLKLIEIPCEIGKITASETIFQLMLTAISSFR